MNNSKEIEITYTNWDVDDIILELARYIKEGFSVASYSHYHSFSSGLETTVRLIELYKCKE